MQAIALFTDAQILCPGHFTISENRQQIRQLAKYGRN